MDKIYDEIFKLLNKYKDQIIFDIEDLQRKALNHLYGLELKEKHGLNIDPKDIHSLNYSRFGEYMSIGLWGDKYGRRVSWSDDDLQPEDEMLLQISFPTGAYIFGNNSAFSTKDYPVEFFNKFFNELKSYKPKYTDSHNHNLYNFLDQILQIYNKSILI